MNYRHAYHAGNFADCFKHALLVDLLDSLARKTTPYFVLDTHAGAGRYDLDAEPAQLTGEAGMGIRRLMEEASPALERYISMVKQLGLYPGSPALIRSIMRDTDRLTCCELHPQDIAILRGLFRRDPRVEVHERSGWEAVGALLPPREKRGLVFVDPPFENQDEMLVVADSVRRGHARFGHGMFAVWYPLKHMAAVRGLHADLTSSGIRDIVAVEVRLRETTAPGQFSGCGLIVINPPYQFDSRAYAIASAVVAALGDRETGVGTTVTRLADE